MWSSAVGFSHSASFPGHPSSSVLSVLCAQWCHSLAILSREGVLDPSGLEPLPIKPLGIFAFRSLCECMSTPLGHGQHLLKVVGSHELQRAQIVLYSHPSLNLFHILFAFQTCFFLKKIFGARVSLWLDTNLCMNC